MDIFTYSNVNEVSEAEIVIIGVPDESKSHSKRKGTSKGPDILRMVTNESNFFEREGSIIPICPMRGNLNKKHIFDYGNVDRKELYRTVFDLVSNNKIPIVIGGDHSITTIILQAIGNLIGKVGLLYFDAHPDFVSSTTNYYGSVLSDSSEWIDFKESVLIGTRSAEAEELENVQKSGLEIITPLDINEKGISNILDKIKSKHHKGKKYISIDLDCLDPAYAPGVSVPSAGGISSIDLISLIKLTVSLGIVGMDIVELSPDFDVNNITSLLASRLLLESIASIKTS
ncbi:arginase family protein [Candidatus Nitrosocosmicus franklandus]|uniref:Proclavaminate amidinohydrolase n=1 Tax=Candidatus Nitrosocosmicus franklandianus TaxID=1798806 RepID=A0A484IEF7_9ARCH|nr:arginase family protein [Candidatus Nitrosocosmicus franklandus]VFJ14032.1 Proclavaminate amidinohydrolase [Candidatus Nitrosocosmicus franklandus]